MDLFEVILQNKEDTNKNKKLKNLIEYKYK